MWARLTVPESRRWMTIDTLAGRRDDRRRKRGAAAAHTAQSPAARMEARGDGTAVQGMCMWIRCGATRPIGFGGTGGSLAAIVSP